MKKLLLILAVAKLSHSHAQFAVGNQGITIKSNTDVSIGNLSLTPSSDFTLANNTLQNSETALPVNNRESINRVYRFESPVNYSGTVSINYLPSELNSNIEGDLQILYALDESQSFTVTTASSLNLSAHRISNTLSNVNLKVLSAINPATPMPVKLINFDVKAEGLTAQLRWSTTEEVNAERFEVERSADAKNWNLIGTEKAKGVLTGTQTYTYMDANITEGTNYYRLKMVDLDQSYAYSQIRSALFSRQDDFVIYPNPVTEKLYFKNVPGNDVVQIAVFGVQGQLLFKQGIKPGENLVIKDLLPGTYILKMNMVSGRQSSHTFVKQ